MLMQSSGIYLTIDLKQKQKETEYRLFTSFRIALHPPKTKKTKNKRDCYSEMVNMSLCHRIYCNITTHQIQNF